MTCIAEIYDADTAAAIRIQYGGSVNAGNAAELFAMGRHRRWSCRRSIH
ncbi:MAG: triose-phosphate isomerase [Ruminococcus sp.]